MSNLRPQTLPTVFAIFAIFLLALPAHGGLIAHYSFDTADGGLLADKTGNSHTLTNNGSVTNPSTGLAGGQSASFSGADADFLYEAAASTAFDPGTGPWAWSFWYKPASSTATGSILGHGDFRPISDVDPSSGMAVILGGENGGVDPDVLAFISGEYAPLAGSPKPAVYNDTVGSADDAVGDNNGFHHVIVQRRSTGTVGELEMWFDGVKVGSGTVDNTMVFDSGMAFAIGAHAVESNGDNNGASGHAIGGIPDGLNFSGQVDEVRIFNMELDTDAIAELFGAPVDGGGGGSGGVPEPSSLVLLVLGLVGFSRFLRRRG